MPDTALSSPPPAPPAADLQACESLMRGGSRSFFAASRVLPSRIRSAAVALYAFCRVADDAIDLAPDPALALVALRRRLDRIYAGLPLPTDADTALAGIVGPYALPRGLLEALLEGFQWDAEGREYETIEQVCDYGARVAGTVGALMALVMGTRSPPAIARACELGVAMQLTNIARDVGEDARNGRLYLPRQWLREEGVDVQRWLQAPRWTPAIARVVARVLAYADDLYQRAPQGIAYLPRDCRPAIQAARLVYAEIGREIERRGLDSVSGRAVVGTARKRWLMVRALSAGVLLPTVPRGGWPILPAVAPLVDLAAEPGPPLARGESFYHRTIWVIGLCERLRERERAQWLARDGQPLA